MLLNRWDRVEILNASVDHLTKKTIIGLKGGVRRVKNGENQESSVLFARKTLHCAGFSFFEADNFTELFWTLSHNSHYATQ